MSIIETTETPNTSTTTQEESTNYAVTCPTTCIEYSPNLQIDTSNPYQCAPAGVIIGQNKCEKKFAKSRSQISDEVFENLENKDALYCVDRVELIEYDTLLPKWQNNETVVYRINETIVHRPEANYGVTGYIESHRKTCITHKFGYNLSTIDLSNCNIYDISPGVFSERTQELIFYSNHLAKIAEGVLPNGLKKLVVNSNNFARLSDIAMNESLECLSAQNNKIISIDNCQFPSTLASLNLSNNLLTNENPLIIPDTVYYLNIACNNFKNGKNIILSNNLKSLVCDAHILTDLVIPDTVTDLKMIHGRVISIPPFDLFTS